MKTFVQELKTRRVYRVALAYVIVGSGTVQLMGTVMPMFHAPEWAQQVFVVLLAIGFPMALVLAWCFDIKQGAIELTCPGTGPAAPVNQRRLWALGLIGCLIAGAGVAVYWFWHPWRAQPRIEAASLPFVPEKSIAVLPFENLGDQKEAGFFADGVHDEILTNLAKVADLKVISRTSVMQYKNRAERNLREIARALGVAHVVEGTVQRADGRVRVNAQLIDARTDTHLWAEQYDRKLSDVFAIETELAEKIVAQLKSELSPQEKAAIEEQPTADLVAFDLYTRAKKLIEAAVISLPLQESLFEAIRLLDQAIERDPKFALVYYQLATAHDLLYFVGTDHTPARLAMAEAAIDSLTQLRPASGEAHLARARHLYWVYQDYDKAREELTLAQRTLPNDPLLFTLGGYMDRRQSRWEDSTKKLERAIELDPRNPYNHEQVGRTYQYLRRYADAARAFDRAVALAPKDSNMRGSRAEIDFQSRGDLQPLASTIDSILRDDAGATKNVSSLWLQLAQYQRDTTAAERALAALPQDGCHVETIPFPRSWCEGQVALMKGDKKAARAAFTVAHEETVKLLRDQPEYAQALCVLGMTEAMLGHKEKAIRAGRHAIELLPVSRDSIGGSFLIEYLALIYAWTGEKDLAFEQLALAVRAPGYLSYGALRFDPYWDALRRDPRFDQIVASLAPP